MKKRLSTRYLAASLIMSTTIIGTAEVYAKTGPVMWNPAVTERLVKLPKNHLKKSLDRDFARSPLADAITNNKDEIMLKVDTLGDLRKAAEQAEGDLRVELRHQLLVEKREYLKLVKQRQELRRQHLVKRKNVYVRILNKVLRTRGASSVETKKLVRQQEAAQVRFEKSSEAVDMKLFTSFDAPDSKYAREYARNLSAANALMQAINAHPMQKQEQQGDPTDKPTYLRRLVSNADAKIALVNQEDKILGYMAKLVALDAAALAEELEADTETVDADKEIPSPVTSALNHFIN